MIKTILLALQQLHLQQNRTQDHIYLIRQAKNTLMKMKYSQKINIKYLSEEQKGKSNEIFVKLRLKIVFEINDKTYYIRDFSSQYFLNNYLNIHNINII